VNAPALPPVWFDRPVLPDLAGTIEAACTVLGPATPADPYAGVEPAVAALVGAGPYGESFMDRAPGLRVIARTGIGYDSVDVAAATRRGIAVCNTPDGPTTSTAEHAIALLLAVCKRLGPAEAALRSGATSGYYARHRAIELDGKVLGLVGFGRIARRVARIAEGLGMSLVVVDPYLDPASVPSTVRRATTLDEVLRVADVVSIHVPLTGESAGMFDAARFAAMKPGAVLINTARGGLVDQDALLAALEAGRLAGAGLDVTTPEPLPPDHPLLEREDVVVTPHVASATTEGKARMLLMAFEEAMAVVAGRRPKHLVNPEMWDVRAPVARSGGRG
jgi:D-3-phosphoglycerate dehydrogenase / 2-oxoglutarate reductase